MKPPVPFSPPLAVGLVRDGSRERAAGLGHLRTAVQHRPPRVTVTPAPAPRGLWWLLELLGCFCWGGRASGIH